MSAHLNRTALAAAGRHFNAGDLAAYLTTLYAPDAVAHFLPPGMPQGHTGLQLYYRAFMDGFPDAQLYFDDTVAAGDKLAVRFHITATHAGAFNGIPATGKRVNIEGISILRFAGGKVVERWSQSDFLGLLQQLGALRGAGAQ